MLADSRLWERGELRSQERGSPVRLSRFQLKYDLRRNYARRQHRGQISSSDERASVRNRPSLEGCVLRSRLPSGGFRPVRGVRMRRFTQVNHRSRAGACVSNFSFATGHPGRRRTKLFLRSLGSGLRARGSLIIRKATAETSRKGAKGRQGKWEAKKGTVELLPPLRASAP